MEQHSLAAASGVFSTVVGYFQLRLITKISSRGCQTSPASHEQLRSKQQRKQRHKSPCHTPADELDAAEEREQAQFMSTLRSQHAPAISVAQCHTRPLARLSDRPAGGSLEVAKLPYGAHARGLLLRVTVPIRQPSPVHWQPTRTRRLAREQAPMQPRLQSGGSCCTSL